ncbi:hypothetical protein SAMN05421858_0596 [Haladaptatus litoreus]|uniref:Uncharacterized protein n=1 Tax=Haladaptatus litoreus TaxID=553468 RepID=A0A1N6W425_9EURY|nr:hypothetical protein [Haladaptatus litoreus]SIQ84891.1 hypothetical protein SAMN05421858_0596 [Haladaptatus litoreus]
MVSHGECQTESLKTGTDSQPSTGGTTPPVHRYGCRLSWQLGDRLRRLDTVTLASELADSRSKRTLSVYDPDGDTYLVRLRTAVGREKYREIPKTEFDPVLDTLSREGRWNFVASARRSSN